MDYSLGFMEDVALVRGTRITRAISAAWEISVNKSQGLRYNTKQDSGAQGAEHR